MKTIFLAAALVVCFAGSSGAQAADSTPRAAPASAHDALFGLDKPKHFVLSAFIESSTFAGLEAAGASRGAAMAAGLSVTSLFAIGREIHDRRTKGLFSVGDLVWDGLGAAGAAVMLRHTYR